MARSRSAWNPRLDLLHVKESPNHRLAATSSIRGERHLSDDEGLCGGTPGSASQPFRGRPHAADLRDSASMCEVQEPARRAGS
jgi:hypothetical protein